jgi:hypothetical protein
MEKRKPADKRAGRRGEKYAPAAQCDTPGKVYMKKTGNAGKTGPAGLQNRKKDEKKLKTGRKNACNSSGHAL